jgi:Ran GTPase-activating protein (RanGAP) involved in mRNA processing and transport
LLANLLRHNSPIRGLFLNVNYLNDAGVKVLAGGLQPNQTLLELGLASNGIGIEGCEESLAVLQNHPALINLDLGYSPSTRVLAANPNRIRDIGASAIARFLTHNQTLLRLDLRGNDISDRGKSLLIAALESNRKLRHLLLDGKPDLQLNLLLERNRLLNPDGDLQIPLALLLSRAYIAEI